MVGDSMDISMHEQSSIIPQISLMGHTDDARGFEINLIKHTITRGRRRHRESPLDGSSSRGVDHHGTALNGPWRLSGGS